MHLFYVLISACLGLLFFFGVNIDGHEYDLCGMGATGVQETNLNVNMSYKGLDSSNSDYPLWEANCLNVSLQWGGKWGDSRYYLKRKGNAFIWFGRCNENNVLPLDCQNWVLWNGSALVIDNDFSIRNCSYYTVSFDFFCCSFFFLFVSSFFGRRMKLAQTTKQQSNKTQNTKYKTQHTGTFNMSKQYIPS